MSQNPLNLVLRFLLELVGLAALAYWGWTQHEGIGRALAVVVPLVAATLWGVFRVPGDPRDAPVAVPGPVRLLLEAAYFGTAVLLLAAANQPSAATILGGVVLAHYAASYDRVARLLSNRSFSEG